MNLLIYNCRKIIQITVSVEETYQVARFTGSCEELVEKVKHSHSAIETQRIVYANRNVVNQLGKLWMQLS